MALFEDFEGRIPQINKALKEYGFSEGEAGLNEARELCKSKGFDPYAICEQTQQICFEDAKWAYVLGSAIAINAGKKWAMDDPFVVLNGDDLCFYLDGRSMTKEVIDIYNATGDTVVYGKELPREVMYKYSSMVLGEECCNGKGSKMLDIIEKPAPGTEPSNIMGFCRYVLNAEFFDRIFK